MKCQFRIIKQYSAYGKSLCLTSQRKQITAEEKMLLTGKKSVQYGEFRNCH